MTGDLHKLAMAAAGRTALSAVKKLNQASVWRSVGNLADRRLAAGGGRGWGAAKRVSGVMGSGVGTGIGLYGMAGMAMPSLPGADLALAAGAPAWALADALPHGIKSTRMLSAKNQAAAKRDALTGAQAGTDDFLSVINADPSTLQRNNGLRDFMLKNVGEFSGDRYMTNQPPPAMNAWTKLKSVLTNSQGLVDDGVRRGVFDEINKQAMVGKALSFGGKALSALAPVAAAGSAYAIGDSLLSEKPYDEGAVQREGYAGAHGALQKRLNGATSWERLAMRLDPTLAAQGVESKMPGSLAHWQQSTGGKFTPGWLADIKEAWRTGGKPSYYTHDAAGTRHYIS